MKTLKSVIAAACFAAVLPAAAYAESMRVSVPFPFHVNNQVFPAGDYVVAADYARNVAFVQALDTGAGCFTPVMLRETNGFQSRGKVVFRRYAGAAFLESIEPSTGYAYRMFPSARERESAHGRAQRVVVAEVRR